MSPAIRRMASLPAAKHPRMGKLKCTLPHTGMPPDTPTDRRRILPVLCLAATGMPLCAFPDSRTVYP